MSKLTLVPLLKLAITVIVVGWLSYYLQIEKIVALFDKARLSMIALALIILPINLALQAIKWHFLLRSSGVPCSHRASLYSLMAGFPLGLVTPGRWGELGRGLFLRQADRIQVLVLAAFDKIYNLLAMTLAGVVALLYLQHTGAITSEWSYPLLLLFVVTCIVQMLALHSTFLFRVSRLRIKLLSRWSYYLEPLSTFSSRSLQIVWLLSAAFVLIYCLQLVILIHSFSEITLLKGLAGSAATFFVKSILPIAIGDLGIREGAAAFFFDRLGILPQAAFNASLLLFVINLLLPSLVGMILIWKFKAESKND